MILCHILLMADGFCVGSIIFNSIIDFMFIPIFSSIIDFMFISPIIISE